MMDDIFSLKIGIYFNFKLQNFIITGPAVRGSWYYTLPEGNALQ
jgi:hypothetical protein